MQIILIVDDLGRYGALAEALAACGHEVVQQSTTPKAIAAAVGAALEPCFLLANASPIGLRIHAASIRKAFGTAHPVLAIVQREDAGELPHLLAAGVDDFVVWPRDPKFFATRLKLVDRRWYGPGADAATRGAPGPPQAAISTGDRLLARVTPVLSVSIYVMDVQDREVRYASSVLPTALGVSASDVDGLAFERWLGLVHPDDRAGLEEQLGQWAGVGDDAVMVREYRVKGPHSSWRWIETREMVLSRDPDGAPRQVVGVASDKTDDRAQQLSMAVAEARERLLFAHRAEILYDWDFASGRLDFHGADDDTRRDLPPTRETWEARIHPEDADRVIAAVEQSLHERRGFNETYRVRWPDGHWRTLREQALVVRDRNGDPVRWLALLRPPQHTADAADADLALPRGSRVAAAARLAGVVAEALNPLVVRIFTNIDYAIAELPIGATRRDLLEARAATEEAATVTRQLQAFGRRQVLSPEYISMNDVIGDAIDVLTRAAGSMVEFSFESSQHLGAVLADPLQIEQLLLTLCQRAGRAMPRGGQLTIATSVTRARDEGARLPAEAGEADYVKIVVADSSAAIPEDRLPHVFEPFQAAEDETLETGLELSVVHGIVTQHEGFAHVENLANGEGVRFTIYLPVVKRPPARLRRPSSDAPKGGRETVLIVDDDELVRNMAQRLLRGAGYQVMTARDGQEACELISAHKDRIQLVILDMIMPRMGGRVVYERMAAETHHMRYAFISGYTMSADDTDFVQERHRVFIPKPFSGGQLLREIRRALDG